MMRISNLPTIVNATSKASLSACIILSWTLAASTQGELWHAELKSPGGPLPFGLELNLGESPTAFVINGKERVPFSKVKIDGDQVRMECDWYDSRIVARFVGGDVESAKTMHGTWSKAAPQGKTSSLEFRATRGHTDRFSKPAATKSSPQGNHKEGDITGDWVVKFTDDGGEEIAIGQFAQVGRDVTGTFLTRTGDYRFLVGSFDNGWLQLSTFTDERELAYLARRLDFPNARAFLDAYDRHSNEVRTIYDLYLGEQPGQPPGSSEPSLATDDSVSTSPDGETSHLRSMDAAYAETFSREEISRHAELISQLDNTTPVVIETAPGRDGTLALTVVGYDEPGDLAMICGLLFAHGFDIVAGHAFTSQPGSPATQNASTKTRLTPITQSRIAIDTFLLKSSANPAAPNVWDEYRADLTELISLARAGQLRNSQGLLVRRVAAALRESTSPPAALAPIELRVDNEVSARFTVLQVGAADTPGFLYELANSLTLLGFSIERVVLNTRDHQAIDTFFIVGADGLKVTDLEQQNRLRAAVVLVKHFTHLLPTSPGPRRALEHFRDFLTQLFEHADWTERLATIDRQEVLEPLARLLGVSDFLWNDYLRLQHDNLFPVLQDAEGRGARRSLEELNRDLHTQLASAIDFTEQQTRLNEFKDREMFRVDMRHIEGLIPNFQDFAEELSDVAEAVVRNAVDICRAEVSRRHRERFLQAVADCPFVVAALGKAGGRELGFASDIELMFVYDDACQLATGAALDAGDYFSDVVKLLMRTIRARRKGIFELDLRLRPYGNAGPLAVALSAFESYFRTGGPAWPFERQALVKLRSIAGNADLGTRLASLRDSIVYAGATFDAAAMRAMRERQIQQHVKAGTWNAKLSDGGLVDCEYLVQGLQIAHGSQTPAIRSPNTLDAIAGLQAACFFSDANADSLATAYLFLRRLIDALRMVRGDARDLTVPDADSEEFDFLARRLAYGSRSSDLKNDIQQVSQQVSGLLTLLNSDRSNQS